MDSHTYTTPTTSDFRLVREIPEGEHNIEVEIKATRDGIMIDENVFIPWEWVHRAHSRLP